MTCCWSWSAFSAACTWPEASADWSTFSHPHRAQRSDALLLSRLGGVTAGGVDGSPTAHHAGRPAQGPSLGRRMVLCRIGWRFVQSCRAPRFPPRVGPWRWPTPFSSSRLLLLLLAGNEGGFFCLLLALVVAIRSAAGPCCGGSRAGSPSAERKGPGRGNLNYVTDTEHILGPAGPGREFERHLQGDAEAVDQRIRGDRFRTG